MCDDISVSLSEIVRLCPDRQIKKNLANQLKRLQSASEENNDKSRIPHIMLTGEFSSGKSSLINKLVGRKLIPSALFETTPIVSYYEHDPDCAEIEARYSIGGASEIAVIGSENVARLIKSLRIGNNGAKLTKFHCKLRLEMLGDSKLVLIDTPGTNGNCDFNVIEYLRNTTVDYLLYLSQSLITNQESEIIKKIIDSKPVCRMGFVCTKMDNHVKTGEMNIEKVQADFTGKLKKFHGDHDFFYLSLERTANRKLDEFCANQIRELLRKICGIAENKTDVVQNRYDSVKSEIMREFAELREHLQNANIIREMILKDITEQKKKPQSDYGSDIEKVINSSTRMLKETVLEPMVKAAKSEIDLVQEYDCNKITEITKSKFQETSQARNAIGNYLKLLCLDQKKESQIIPEFELEQFDYHPLPFKPPFEQTDIDNIENEISRLEGEKNQKEKDKAEQENNQLILSEKINRHDDELKLAENKYRAAISSLEQRKTSAEQAVSRFNQYREGDVNGRYCLDKEVEAQRTLKIHAPFVRSASSKIVEKGWIFIDKYRVPQLCFDGVAYNNALASAENKWKLMISKFQSDRNSSDEELRSCEYKLNNIELAIRKTKNEIVEKRAECERKHKEHDDYFNHWRRKSLSHFRNDAKSFVAGAMDDFRKKTKKAISDYVSQNIKPENRTINSEDSSNEPSKPSRWNQIIIDEIDSILDMKG